MWPISREGNPDIGRCLRPYPPDHVEEDCAKNSGRVQHEQAAARTPLPGLGDPRQGGPRPRCFFLAGSMLLAAARAEDHDNQKDNETKHRPREMVRASHDASEAQLCEPANWPTLP